MMQGCSSCTSCTIFINFFLSAPYSASWANHLKLYRTALTRVRQSVNMSFLANSPLEAICYSLAFGSSRKCGGAIKIQKYGIILKNHTRFNIINSAVGYSWCLMGSYQDTTFFCVLPVAEMHELLVNSLTNLCAHVNPQISR